MTAPSSTHSYASEAFLATCDHSRRTPSLSPPCCPEIQNCLPPEWLCFSSCRAAAGQIFSYRLKIHMQQSGLWCGSVDARSQKEHRGEVESWNSERQWSYRERQVYWFYMPRTRLLIGNTWNKTFSLALSRKRHKCISIYSFNESVNTMWTAITCQSLLENGGVGGHSIIFFCENSKITTRS